MTDLLSKLKAAEVGTSPEWQRFLQKHGDDTELLYRALMLEWWWQQGLASAPGWAVTAVYGPGRRGTVSNRKRAAALQRALEDSGIGIALLQALKEGERDG